MVKKRIKTKTYSCKIRLVFLHIPLYDPRASKHYCLPQEESLFLLNLFKSYKISHIFAGHIHGYFQGKWGNIPYTISGGAGAKLYGNDPKHFFYHYLKISIKNGMLKIEVKRIPVSSPEWIDYLLYFIYDYIFNLEYLKVILYFIILILIITLVWQKFKRNFSKHKFQQNL